MMTIPRRIGMSFCISACWRGALPYDEETLRQHRVSAAQMDHILAFSNCVAVADRNIRRHAGPREVATIVAEDVPEMRTALKKTLRAQHDGEFHHRPDELRTTKKDEKTGYKQQSGDMHVLRIRKAIHFVEKDEDPLVQLADACAFGLRRYFAGEKFGPGFADAILGFGSKEMLAAFGRPSGTECYWNQNSSHRLKTFESC